MIDGSVMRPTYISREKYSSFVQRCKNECKNPRDTLEKLLVLYINKGENVFSKKNKKVELG